MANYTEKLNLTKPLKTEQYNIDIFNNNSDIIDTFATNVDINLNNISTNKANINLSNVSTISNSSAVKVALDSKVNISDIWYDSTSHTLYIGVAQQ